MYFTWPLFTFGSPSFNFVNFVISVGAYCLPVIVSNATWNLQWQVVPGLLHFSKIMMQNFVLHFSVPSSYKSHYFIIRLQCCVKHAVRKLFNKILPYLKFHDWWTLVPSCEWARGGSVAPGSQTPTTHPPPRNSLHPYQLHCCCFFRDPFHKSVMD